MTSIGEGCYGWQSSPSPNWPQQQLGNNWSGNNKKVTLSMLARTLDWRSSLTPLFAPMWTSAAQWQNTYGALRPEADITISAPKEPLSI